MICGRATTPTQPRKAGRDGHPARRVEPEHLLHDRERGSDPDDAENGELPGAAEDEQAVRRVSARDQEVDGRVVEPPHHPAADGRQSTRW